MGEVYAVTSGKGGVGKSTVAVGLAEAFSATGKNVLLVDMDEGLRCLDLLLGLDKDIVFDLSDILIGKEISDAVYKADGNDKINLIPAPLKSGLVNAYNFKTFIDEAKSLFDILIIDFPAGIDFTLYSCLPDDSLFLTVACPDKVSVRDSAMVSKNLEEINRKSKLIINNFNYKKHKTFGLESIDNIIDKSSLQLLGIVPISTELNMLSLNHYIKPRCKAMLAFSRIVARLEGKEVFLPQPKKI